MDDPDADVPTGGDGDALVAALPEPLAIRWPLGLRRLRADPRRGLPFAVAVAWPLAVEGSTALLDRCRGVPLNFPSRPCLYEPAFLVDVALELVELLLVAVLAATVLYALVGRRVERAFDDRLGRLLFEPGRATLVVLGALHLAAFSLAGPLFDGGLGTGRSAFFLLAVPAYPLLGGAFLSEWARPLFDAATTGLSPTVANAVELPWLLALVVVTATLNVVWLYLLAGAVGGAWSALMRAVTDRR